MLQGFLDSWLDLFQAINWNGIQSWLVYDPKRPILFNTPLFLGLFLVFFPIYIYTTRLSTFTFRNLYVLAFSLFFYYKSSGIYFLLLLFSGLVDFALAKLIFESTNQKLRKVYLIISVVTSLGLLGYFKYTNFLIDNFNSIFDGNIQIQDILLPVGISFYTFQSMSYIIDIYRKTLSPTKSLLDYLFFISFFPQLVAGPIVRAADFIPQIYAKLSLSREDLNKALLLILGGMIKKTVISDYISLNFVDRVFDAPNSYTAFENLLASYGYTIQIYCDFSGYSDMAIGIALLMGFKLPTNFRTPYQSASITEFWRRWHISLSSWLRDYLYISLGGNRKGKLRTYFNLFMTMLLGGLWHGASWKFVVWGVLHGLALVVEKLFKDYLPLPKNRFTWIISLLATFHFVVFCWIFFRAKDFDTAFLVIQNISKVEYNLHQWLIILQGYQNVILMMVIGFAWHFLPENLVNFLANMFHKMPLVLKALIVAAAIWLVYASSTSGPQPFIYFQF